MSYVHEPEEEILSLPQAVGGTAFSMGLIVSSFSVLMTAESRVKGCGLRGKLRCLFSDMAGAVAAWRAGSA